MALNVLVYQRVRMLSGVSLKRDTLGEQCSDTSDPFSVHELTSQQLMARNSGSMLTMNPAWKTMVKQENKFLNSGTFCLVFQSFAIKSTHEPIGKLRCLLFNHKFIDLIVIFLIGFQTKSKLACISASSHLCCYIKISYI